MKSMIKELKCLLKHHSNNITILIHLFRCARIMYAYRSRRMGRRIDAIRFVIVRDNIGVHTLSVF